MKRSGFLGIVVLAAFALPMGAQTRAASSQSSTALDAAAQAAKALAKVPADSFHPGEVPEPGRGLLVQLKHALRDTATEVIHSADAARNPAAMQRDLEQHLREAGVYSAEPGSDAHPYRLAGISLSRPPRHDDLLALTTTIAVPCGTDASLYIYGRRANRWELLLAQEVHEYKNLASAQNGMDFAISPPDEAGKWFVVVATLAQACGGSHWQDLRYLVLRPGASADSPVPVQRGNVSAFTDKDEVYKLSAERDRFRLSWWGHANLSPGNTRIHLAAFAVRGNRTERASPLAVSPEDFVDEWTALPWSEAARWSNPDLAKELEDWHRQISEMARDSAIDEISFVQPCPAGGWQVGVSADDPTLPEKAVIFTVAQEQGVFRVERVDRKRPPGCPGQTHPANPDSSVLPAPLL